MGQRTTHRSDLLNLTPGFHHGIAAAALGETVGVDKASARENLREGTDARLGCALSAAYHPAQALQVVASTLRMGENAAEHHRREPGAGEPVSGDGRKRAIGGE